MKSIVPCLILAMTCTCVLVAGETANVVNLPKDATTGSIKGFTNVILLPTKGIRNVGMIEQAQQKYIQKLYPDHRVMLSVYVKDEKGRYIEAVSCVNSDNEMVQVYFDMSDVYQYLKKKGNQSKLEVEQLEESYVTVQ